jgi:hypothetical protein
MIGIVVPARGRSGTCYLIEPSESAEQETAMMSEKVRLEIFTDYV